MTVGDNVAYGLTIRKVPRAERERRVAEALEMVRLDRLRAPQAVAALRRATAARRPRAGAREPAPRPAPRRAPRRARPQAPRGDADRAQGDPAGGRDHVRLRHPRPGGGADDERSSRRLQPRSNRADRDARGALRASVDAFVAGFVGTSNLLSRRRREALVGGKACSPSAPRRSGWPNRVRGWPTTRSVRMALSARWCTSGRTRATSWRSMPAQTWWSLSRT